MSPQSTTLQTDRRAVSPVIGVILLVAITVILAAVIGAFVLSQDTPTNPPRYTISEQSTADTLTLQITNVQNPGDITVHIGGTETATFTAPTAGDSITITGVSKNSDISITHTTPDSSYTVYESTAKQDYGASNPTNAVLNGVAVPTGPQPGDTLTVNWQQSQQVNTLDAVTGGVWVNHMFEDSVTVYDESGTQTFTDSNINYDAAAVTSDDTTIYVASDDNADTDNRARGYYWTTQGTTENGPEYGTTTDQGEPSAIAITDSHVFVAVTGTIEKRDSNMQLQTTYPDVISTITEQIGSMAASDSEELYYYDQADGSIVKLDSTGNEVWRTSVSNNGDLAVINGDVYYITGKTGTFGSVPVTVTEYDPATGSTVQTQSYDSKYIRDDVAVHNGNIYIAGELDGGSTAGYVGVVNPDTLAMNEYGIEHEPQQTAIANGYIYTTDGFNIYQYTHP